jgi:hypothetical protein
VLCPVCANTAQRSTVRITRTNSGALPKDHYFDEEGAEHSHNPNIVVTEYSCSNGHRFAERSSWQCHCGYRACEQEIVVTPEPPPTVVGYTQHGDAVHGAVTRSSSGKVITAAERAALNEKKGAR